MKPMPTLNKPIVRHLRRPAVQFVRTLQLSVNTPFPSQVVEQGFINPLDGVQATGEPFIGGSAPHVWCGLVAWVQRVQQPPASRRCHTGYDMGAISSAVTMSERSGVS
jgi:hypothetical protein